MPNPYTQYQNGANYYPFNIDYNIPTYGGGGGGNRRTPIVHILDFINKDFFLKLMCYFSI